MQSAGSIQTAGQPVGRACLAVAVILMFAGEIARGQGLEFGSPDQRAGRLPSPAAQAAGIDHRSRTRSTRICFCDDDAIAESGRAADVTGPDWKPDQDSRHWQYLVLHHSGTERGSVASIHADHRSRRDAQGRPWLGIGYHFVIGNGRGERDGEVIATFRWEQQIHGAHAGDALFNARGIGICLIGNFEHTRPTRRQLEAVRQLVAVLARRYAIPPQHIMGHQTIKPTACPGRHLPLSDLRRIAADSSAGQPGGEPPRRTDSRRPQPAAGIAE